MAINNKMPLKVGITGGIGTGKTTVSKLFESLNVPVYYSDDRAKMVMNENPQLITKLKQAFGNEVYLDNGTVNRPYLAGIVFNNTEKLNLLNSIVHPAVEEDYLLWLASHKNVPYTLKESAILFESGLDKHIDKVIVVTAPLELRIQRVMKRDNAEKAAVLARINKQMPQEEKDKKADFLVTNIAQEDLMAQVEKIHSTLINIF